MLIVRNQRLLQCWGGCVYLPGIKSNRQVTVAAGWGLTDQPCTCIHVMEICMSVYQTKKKKSEMQYPEYYIVMA